MRWWVLGTVAEQEIATSTRLLRYYLRAPYALHQRRHTGELMRNMNDATVQVYGQVVLGSIAALTDLITIGVMLVLLIIAAPVPTLMLIVYFGVAAVLYQRTARPRLVRVGEVLMESSVAVYRAAIHALGGVKDLKLSGRDGHFLDEFRSARVQAARARRTSSFLTELPKHVLELLFILGVGLMTVYVFTTRSTTTAFSTVALFAAAGFRILPSITSCLAGLNAVRAGRKALALVREDIEASLVTPDDGFSERRRVTMESGLVLEDVWFRYEGSDTDVLRGIDLTIPAGTSVALVGGSGAGKTTLVDLILGLHRPTRGSITCDGSDIGDQLHDWQAGIGLVPQEVFLSDGTLRENIALGEYPDRIDEARVRRALEQAQLRDVVEALPEGLDSSIGEAGGRLSGGQRQRIGIARALYQDPALLVLDEATSALDNATEHRVTETIRQLHGEVTLVVVAHRLSTVRHCDLVVYLSQGRVVSAGSFDSVCADNAEFAELVRLGALSGVERKATEVESAQ